MKAHLLLAAALVLLLAGCAEQRPEGFVQGKVTIGPLCPVEPCSEPPNLDAYYGERKVVAYSADTKQKVAEAELSSSGGYFMALPTGNYILDVTDVEGRELGVDRQRGMIGEAVPKEIEVAPGESMTVDIDIDTGIR